MFCPCFSLQKSVLFIALLLLFFYLKISYWDVAFASVLTFVSDKAEDAFVGKLWFLKYDFLQLQTDSVLSFRKCEPNLFGSFLLGAV